MSKSQEHYDLEEFVKGQKDCREGIPHEDGSASYNRGYQLQYELEQIKSELTEQS